MFRILLVEDQKVIRELLSRHLQRWDYEVIEAVDGEQGVQMAQSEAPDLILMDMGLPVLDGWEATRQLKAAPATRSIPIVAVTGQVTAADRDKIFEAGCDAFEAKPIDFPQLMRKVRDLLGQTATT